MNKSNINIFVWHCRGAASTSFHRYCKQYVSMYNPSILVIVETRCNTSKLKSTFNLLGYDGFEASEGQGYAGGIVVAWEENLT
jgi:exonuclease III